VRYKGKKGKAWEAVKKWARRKRTDCYTCSAKNLTSYNAQAGHYQPVALVGSNNTLSWDEHQIRLQCGHCNGAGQGMQVEFRAGLVREYGEDFVKELDMRVHRVDPIKDWDSVIARFESL
jgi:hypothetical protein